MKETISRRRTKETISRRPRGRVRGYDVSPGGILTPQTDWGPNLVLRGWASIVSKLLAGDPSAVPVNAMYFEFENVADVDVPVDPPTYDRDPASGRAYYAGLTDSDVRDYLRVPLTSATLDSSDETLYPDGNVTTYFAQTGSGGTGQTGKEFSAAANSVVFGVALVAMYDQGDESRDVVFSRYYWTGSGQMAKRDGSQKAARWEITIR